MTLLVFRGGVLIVERDHGLLIKGIAHDAGKLIQFPNRCVFRSLNNNVGVHFTFVLAGREFKRIAFEVQLVEDTVHDLSGHSCCSV